MTPRISEKRGTPDGLAHGEFSRQGAGAYVGLSLLICPMTENIEKTIMYVMHVLLWAPLDRT